MSSKNSHSDSITQIDKRIRTTIARITNQGDAATRTDAMEEFVKLKARRSQMMATKTFDRMLSSLK